MQAYAQLGPPLPGTATPVRKLRRRTREETRPPIHELRRQEAPASTPGLAGSTMDGRTLLCVRYKQPRKIRVAQADKEQRA